MLWLRKGFGFAGVDRPPAEPAAESASDFKRLTKPENGTILPFPATYAKVCNRLHGISLGTRSTERNMRRIERRHVAQGKFVAYYRVSTDRQSRLGLRLEAQQETVRTFLNGGCWSLVGEFTELESGRSSERPELAKALTHCRLRGPTLIVANVSRLTRSVAFLSLLLEAEVEVRFCDLPQIEGPTGRFMLQQMVAVAELEASLIGDRTRKALAAAKARGKKLGTPANLQRQDVGRDRGRAARTRIADARGAGSRRDHQGRSSFRGSIASRNRDSSHDAWNPDSARRSVVVGHPGAARVGSGGFNTRVERLFGLRAQ